MVAGITLKKLGDAPSSAASERLAALGREASELSARFEALETEDMAAFESYLAACRLPRSTPAEKSARKKARTESIRRATQAPLEMLEAARDTVKVAAGLLDLSRSSPLKAESDLLAAVELARAAFRVAELNVAVNRPLLEAAEAEGVRLRHEQLRREYEELSMRLRPAGPDA
jgi:formiminotetrahydrofolate cyclodeaminase